MLLENKSAEGLGQLKGCYWKRRGRTTSKTTGVVRERQQDVQVRRRSTAEARRDPRRGALIGVGGIEKVVGALGRAQCRRFFILMDKSKFRGGEVPAVSPMPPCCAVCRAGHLERLMRRGRIDGCHYVGQRWGQGNELGPRKGRRGRKKNAPLWTN
jgi:hypothetical protein